ncbi:MAG: porin family protein [Candidatus Aminicenantaceae bacterium]
MKKIVKAMLLGAVIIMLLLPNLSFAIQPEVLYTMKGAKIEATVLDITSMWEFNLSYLEVPVLVKFMIPTPGSVKPNLYAGPAVAIMLSGKVKHKIPGWPVEEEDLRNMQDSDFGLIVGAGIDFGKLMVDVRYVLGLLTASSTVNSDLKNGVISISVGYSL